MASRRLLKRARKKKIDGVEGDGLLAAPTAKRRFVERGREVRLVLRACSIVPVAHGYGIAHALAKVGAREGGVGVRLIVRRRKVLRTRTAFVVQVTLRLSIFAKLVLRALDLVACAVVIAAAGGAGRV